MHVILDVNHEAARGYWALAARPLQALLRGAQPSRRELEAGRCIESS